MQNKENTKGGMKENVIFKLKISCGVSRESGVTEYNVTFSSLLQLSLSESEKNIAMNQSSCKYQLRLAI